ncbi:alpha/beta hydrolase [Massilia sp. PAMC28688]|uniref:alpha/beta fold hydrolase n=1 Tax=Massilia sp. PAMC28688 TaxID=2861283 RepID=UPI001C633E03|nr:alpha/beta hydrolase [Massilia sp. PAMC28688]QYF92408.1 alpha/beta hydrolase [Massilia sp. PAMC28688]
MLVYLIAVAVVILLLAVLAAPEWVTSLGLAIERRISGLKLRKAHVDGFDIPYLDGGKGEVLLLIHGFGGDKDNFTRIARFLTPHYRVIIPDLPGFGDASRNPKASYTMADQVGRMHTFVRQLGIERLHLGGNSMGGFISAQFAAPYAHMVESLWLLDPAGTAASVDTPMIRHYMETGRNPLLVERVEDFEKTISATTHKRPFIPGVARTAMGRRAVRDFELHTMIMRAMKHESPLLEVAFKPMPTPALIVWGAEDQVLSPAGAESFRQLFPQSRVIIMPGIGHLPMLEAPRQTAADYLAFREQLARTGAVQ